MAVKLGPLGCVFGLGEEKFSPLRGAKFIGSSILIQLRDLAPL